MAPLFRNRQESDSKSTNNKLDERTTRAGACHKSQQKFKKLWSSGAERGGRVEGWKIGRVEGWSQPRKIALRIGWQTGLPPASVVSAFLCAGRFLAFLSSTKESCSNDGSGSRRDHLPKVVGSSRARCKQRVALFKSLETTLHFLVHFS